jgi:hypothetical protein
MRGRDPGAGRKNPAHNCKPVPEPTATRTSPGDRPPLPAISVDQAQRVLTTSEAADRLGVSPRTLEHWRLKGGGPVFCKVGHRTVRYRANDLEVFLSEGARINTSGGRPTGQDAW